MYDLRVEYYILDSLTRNIKIQYNENVSYSSVRRIRESYIKEKILTLENDNYNLTEKGKEYYNRLQKELNLKRLDKVIHPDFHALKKPLSKNTIFISKKERS